MSSSLGGLGALGFLPFFAASSSSFCDFRFTPNMSVIFLLLPVFFVALCPLWLLLLHFV